MNITSYTDGSKKLLSFLEHINAFIIQIDLVLLYLKYLLANYRAQMIYLMMRLMVGLVYG